MDALIFPKLLELSKHPMDKLFPEPDPQDTATPRLRERFEEWLAEQDDDDQQLSLSRADVELVNDALWAEEELGSVAGWLVLHMRREARAILAIRAGGDRIDARLREAAAIMGWFPGEGGAYSPGGIGVDYRRLRESTGRVRLVDPVRLEAGLSESQYTRVVDGCPLSRVDAVQVLSEFHEFPSVKACSEYIRRAEKAWADAKRAARKNAKD